MDFGLGEVYVSMRRWFLMLAVAAALTPALARADGESCTTDWQRQVIKCKGSGAPNLDAPTIAVARLGAERAAKADALRNLLEAVRGVKVDGTASGADLLKKDPSLTTKVNGALKNFKVTDTRYFSDGGVEVDVEVPMASVADVLLPKADPASAPATADGPTGVIIDASAFKPAPAIAPRVLDESGAAVYAGKTSYAKDVEGAKKDARVKDHPLVVKALRLAAVGSPDVVISSADAQKLKGSSALADGRVVFVIP